MDVSVIIPAFNPDRELLDKIVKTIKNQKFNGKIEVIVVDRKEAITKQMNWGIMKAKYPIIVMIIQDCLPDGKYWLSILIEPFKNKEVVATTSKVHLPEDLWEEFDSFAKAMTLKERGVISPLLDGKGSAYRKSALKKAGFFDEKNFRTAGDDFDMYIKLKNLGKIKHPECKVFHIHPITFKKRLMKTYQYSNGFGALTRIHKTNMPHWYVGFVNATPIIGIFPQFFNYPFKKSVRLFPYFIIASIVSHPYYLYGFWKGFLTGKQTV
ncbi:glycosyltransferase family 2 protein [Candidatus Pacearchaeota archaeon]|nr:glycosyltransferase family 2 protein [Candidatus Pacearchaeota archaeon]